MDQKGLIVGLFFRDVLQETMEFPQKTLRDSMFFGPGSPLCVLGLLDMSTATEDQKQQLEIVRHQSVLVGGICPSHGTCSSPRWFILDLSFLSLLVLRGRGNQMIVNSYYESNFPIPY